MTVAEPEEAAEAGEPPRAGPVANLVAALLVIAVGVAGLVGSWSLGAGTPAAPGPGTWPLLISLAITGLGIALAVLARRTTDAEAFTGESAKVLVGLLSMAGFVALVGTIGFEIPSVLLALVWLRFLGGETWRLSVVAALGIVVAFYAIFVGALGVPVPHLF
ncbi:tripartite tricarboxylate transporter TctB family protein [Saccharopolyspora cebuensis]|uniref:Tripartite tricarboxylate transporter TctB family protein n=1 Tax=Saccharopolyspora cebuensis TaxID=418759 RepID=A0ABV4CAR4_9PSEU